MKNRTMLPDWTKNHEARVSGRPLRRVLTNFFFLPDPMVKWLDQIVFYMFLVGKASIALDGSP